MKHLSFQVVIDPNQPPHQRKPPITQFINVNEIQVIAKFTNQYRILTAIELSIGEVIFATDNFNFTLDTKLKNRNFITLKVIARFSKNNELHIFDDPVSMAVNFNFVLRYGEPSLNDVVGIEDINKFNIQKLDTKNISVIELKTGGKIFVQENCKDIYRRVSGRKHV